MADFKIPKSKSQISNKFRRPNLKIPGYGISEIRIWRLFVIWTFAICYLQSSSTSFAQGLPASELQVNFSGYFDTFNVSVVYPNVALTKQISESTSLTTRYLVDMVSAASIREASSRVDAVSSASQRSYQLPFDDVRQEFGGGITQLLGSSTISLNGIYSIENDYASATFAGNLTQPFAKKNTVLQLGFVRSWDRVSPVTKNWIRRKNSTSFSTTLSQILAPGALVQMLYSWQRYDGHLSDDYKPVTIGRRQYDPLHPGQRTRHAAATRFKFRLARHTSMQLGYRYYWDDWDVTSHTVSALFQQRVSSMVTIGLGGRGYSQTSAYFFKPRYAAPEQFMTVDNKLDAAVSSEVQLHLTLNGGRGRGYIPFLGSEKVQYNLSASWYQRRTDSPDWFSGLRDLTAAYFNVGFRYRF